MLTDAQCRNATCPPDKKRERLTDSAGLYLEISPAGSKRWFQKIYRDGKETRLALGSYPTVGLTAARRARDAAKLQKAGAINDYEAGQYQSWAYRRLLALVRDGGGLKACLKRIPDEQKAGELCAVIAEKYVHLGLYSQAVKWVAHYYPHTRQAELLEPFVQSVRYLDDKAQRKAIDLADGWLQAQPNDAQLLMFLGELAYSKQLWGKAQGYLEASLAISPSVQARLALAKVFDETEQSAKAESQRLLALEGATHAENEALLALENK